MKFSSDMTVELVQHVGDDDGVAHAARVSTLGDKANLSSRSSEGLINFLMRDRHGTPFEHNSFTFMIKAPIFVFREFHRHRAGWSYNEESGRYRELEPEFYIPSKNRRLVQTGKPGAYTFEAGSADQHGLTEGILKSNSTLSYEGYKGLLDAGVAREVARMTLPLNIYSTMYATCNARSLMHFLSLRTKSHLAKVPSFPQREIEMVAEIMEVAWGSRMPLTYDAFNKHGRVAP